MLAIFSDADRPDMVPALRRTHKILVVTPHVDAEVSDPRSRSLLGRFVEDGTIATLRINTAEEIGELADAYRGLGKGEADVILACKKIASDKGNAEGVLDDRKGRAAAKDLGVKFTGLLGLLSRLRTQGAISRSDHDSTIKALKASKFRLPHDA